MKPIRLILACALGVCLLAGYDADAQTVILRRRPIYRPPVVVVPPRPRVVVVQPAPVVVVPRPRRVYVAPPPPVIVRRPYRPYGRAMW
ncbi:hypothetical protein DYU11_30445 [Fibrisoma montanum]|uniref:Virulence factor n=1 Tax=Fibrisoma montanum TaxID=2305895 RepID=A0A418LX50_9BACT|nr:hypothetical protein [Fibrisoma montanum]RIV17801.1 hypothetical protein DYU11_30445 [Fibrisoma montanum]